MKQCTAYHDQISSKIYPSSLSNSFRLLMPSFFSLHPMSNKLVNKGYGGWAQLGIFTGMVGIGLVAGSLAAMGVWSAMTGQGLMNMEKDMYNPRFATALKMLQMVSTLFIFFLPATLYAFICYKNGWLALGFRRRFTGSILGISILILIACLPLVEALGLLNKAIPLPEVSRTYFDAIEKAYEEQVKVIGDVKTPGQYVLSLFMIALLPAVFEETLFRGGLQNMLSRWKNNSLLYLVLTAVLLVAVRSIWFSNYINPWFFHGGLLVIVLVVYRSERLVAGLNRITNHYLCPIIFVSILFSAIHASWYGFLPRMALGIILGLIFFHTNNLGYNILLHFLNNATVVTVMFLAARQNKPVPVMEEQTFPWWTAFFSAAALVFLFRWLRHRHHVQRPEEVFLDRHNPFENSIFEETKADQ